MLARVLTPMAHVEWSFVPSVAYYSQNFSVKSIFRAFATSLSSSFVLAHLIMPLVLTDGLAWHVSPPPVLSHLDFVGCQDMCVHGWW